MNILIKNMVCRHCVDKVREIFADIGFPDADVQLGVAKISQKELPDSMLQQISHALEEEGFEIIQSREAGIVERVKHALIDESRKDGVNSRLPLAELLTRSVPMSYQQLSRIFTEVEGRTIENYYLNLRIERVKELIKYEGLSLSEIAYRTGFSSVAHLSRQFKQLTGLTPTQFREIGQRRSLPEI